MSSSTFYNLPTFFSHWPTDWILIGAFAALVALDTLRSGSNRGAAFAVSLSVALFVSNALSHAAFLANVSQQFSTATLQALLFAIILIVVYLLTRRILGSFSDSSGAPLQALITGIAVAAVATIFWLQLPALQSVWHFGTQVQMVFGESYRFWWFVGAYTALAFVRS